GEAQRLGLVGWVQNNSRGTAHGQIHPQSRISRAEFSEEKQTAALDHKGFQILK
ncbi:PREDICTED: acylphosphatase-1-like, partial [Leptosomus discolor]|uniref:acylphosphatase-1-like n=1 Tax=Leptosomus discolor TaxID=188344 RepID=UPI000522DB4B